jgi:hypothetical protein
MLPYSIPPNLVDDHLAMGESQVIMCVKQFVVAIVGVFGPTQLRASFLWVFAVSSAKAVSGRFFFFWFFGFSFSFLIDFFLTFLKS